MKNVKIIPDRLYARMQCAASRLTSGSGRVLPFISTRIPFERVETKWRGFVMPGLILAPVVAAFMEPRAMFVIVPIWVFAAWKLGSCPHCRTSEHHEEQAVSAAQDSGEQ